jgi:lysyl-tRNA synthetase class I
VSGSGCRLKFCCARLEVETGRGRFSGLLRRLKEIAEIARQEMWFAANHLCERCVQVFSLEVSRVKAEEVEVVESRAAACR